MNNKKNQDRRMSHLKTSSKKPGKFQKLVLNKKLLLQKPPYVSKIGFEPMTFKFSA